ncbi:MAG: esterase-like activity of phytase family protein [Cyanobium sp.]
MAGIAPGPRLTAAIAAGSVLFAGAFGAGAFAAERRLLPGAATLPLPCPVGAGWQVVRQLELPRRTTAGARIGGFSAARYSAVDDSLLLVSDLPQGAMLRYTGIRGPAMPVLRQSTSLRSGPSAMLPPAIDAEGLVVLNGQWWVASEGRRSAERPAQLLRFSAASGALLTALDLPADWQPSDGPDRARGLPSNGGPESLLLLGDEGRSGEGQPAPTALLMAAERPLLQDPPRQVRLLRWQWPAGVDPAVADPVPLPQGALQLPWGDDWGLTELMPAGSGRLLGLLRRFEPPDRWHIRLALYPLPPLGSRVALAPLAQWDLIAAGLTPDNWEGLSPGPALPDGRPSLLLVSDDNVSALQSNRLALLSARRDPGCG